MPPQPKPSSLALALSGFGTFTLLGAGALGGLVMHLVGGPLAMGLAIWTGRTTEPTDPGSGFWWLGFGALSAAALVPLVLAGKGQAGAAKWGPAASTLAAVVAGALPFIWLWSASTGT
jgi:hypothetical protein